MKQFVILIESLAVWAGIVLLILFWFPVMAVIWLIDRDRARYTTGRWFRLLGKSISRINPRWNITYEYPKSLDDRAPYVMISNHLSNADIPLISNLPWEMKWTAKKELFDIPVLGWMMRMAGDIRVDRKAASRRFGTLKQGAYYLKQKCSIIFFPEGTRSRTGKMGRFNSGAFDLAVQNGVDVLPIAVDGTQEALPRTSWKFNKDCDIRMKVLAPISTKGMERKDIPQLIEQTRSRILEQLAEWRGNSASDNDQLQSEKK